MESRSHIHVPPSINTCCLCYYVLLLFSSFFLMQLRQQGRVVQELGVETPGFQSFLSPGLALGLRVVHSLPPFLVLPPSSLPHIPLHFSFPSPARDWPHPHGLI